MTRDRPKEPDDAVHQLGAMNLAMMSFIKEALDYLERLHPQTGPAYLRPYIDWMKHQKQLLHGGVSRSAVDSKLLNKEAREQLIAEVERSGSDGHLFMRVGRNLIAVLLGDVDPLDLLFRDGLADRFYVQMLANPHHAYQSAAYIEHLCFKNPGMNIIEIGAGRGGQTLCTLEALASNGVKKCARYDYTDISPMFFVQAKEKFKDYADILHFQTCDISQDPTGQSFEPASYDLVIASHVLHATPKLDESILNIRRLLKKGGKFLLFETTSSSGF